MTTPGHALLLATVLLSGQGSAPARQDPRPEKAIGVGGGVPGALAFDKEGQALFEDVHQGTVVEHRFTFRNGGPGAVRIEQGIALSGTGSVEFSPAIVPPGGRGEVRVRQPVEDRLGRAAFRFALVTDEPGVTRYRLGLTGFVESAYDPEAPQLNWGPADKGAVVTAERELFSREVKALSILEVTGAPAFLRVDTSERAGLSAEGVRLRATLDTRQAPLGVTRGVFRVRTNVPDQPECVVSYSLNVVGDVVPSLDAVNLGLIRLGEEGAAEVTLTSRSGRAIEVTGIESPEVPVTTELLPCPGDDDKAGPACRLLRIKHRPSERGHFAGTLSVRVAGLESPLRVTYSGLVVSPQTRIKEIDLPEETAGGAAPMSTPPAQASPAPVGAAPAAEPPQPASNSRGVTLQWKARNESGIHGYLIYRSDRPSGPFVRVNRRIVRAAGGDGVVRAYSFVDEGVEPRRTYYYYLDAVDRSGLKKRFTDVKARQVDAAR
jgi:hypothetical protein